VTLDRYANGGTDELVPQAEALIAKIQATLPETDSPCWTLDIGGAFPCVPAFLSGEPESMWSKHELQDERAPLRVYASMCCSASVGAEDMQRRGAGILAFVLLASRTRAVELYLYSDWSERDSGVGDRFFLPAADATMMPSETAWGAPRPGPCETSDISPTRFDHSFASMGRGDRLRDRYRGDRRAPLARARTPGCLSVPSTQATPITDPVGFVNRSCQARPDLRCFHDDKHTTQHRRAVARPAGGDAPVRPRVPRIGHFGQEPSMVFAGPITRRELTTMAVPFSCLAFAFWLKRDDYPADCDPAISEGGAVYTYMLPEDY
jgi:hypothetical protein